MEETTKYVYCYYEYILLHSLDTSTAALRPTFATHRNLGPRFSITYILHT